MAVTAVKAICTSRVRSRPNIKSFPAKRIDQSKSTKLRKSTHPLRIPFSLLETLKAKNSLLLCKGKKYDCTADLLFTLFRFSRFAYIELTKDLLVWSNPNQSTRRSAVQYTLTLKN